MLQRLFARQTARPDSVPTAARAPVGPPALKSRAALLVAALLTAAIAAVFAPLLNNGFVAYDDDLYVTANRHVQAGLTGQTLHWALTSVVASNWHPLTMVSHALDWQLFGPNPAGHHATSAALHLANTLLLFWLLVRLTGSVGRSGFVAALFALHPLHVESVAWVAERKDVLSTLFWLLALHAYARCGEQLRVGRMIAVAALMTLGLLAKPMLVTLPITLLLLDCWPLERCSGGRALGRLIVEKLPLCVIAGASAWATFLIQQRTGAMASFARLPLGPRAANALVALSRYVELTVWPHGLTVFYPHAAATLSLGRLAAAAALVAALTWLAIRQRRRRPYLLLGWAWFVVTLLPVLGLIQVGDQAHADRYTYVPLIGLFIMVAWGVPDALRRWDAVRLARAGRLALPALACLVLALLSLVAIEQLRAWRSTETLFGRAVTVTRGNYVAHNVLAQLRLEQGRLDEAETQLRAALKARADFPAALYNLGLLMARRGRLDQAVAHYRAALAYNPDFGLAHANLAAALSQQGAHRQALAHYERALTLNPELAEAHHQLGLALRQLGRLDDALPHLEAAVRLDPRSAEARHNLGAALAAQRRFDAAAAQLQEALALRPDFAEAHCHLGRVRHAQGAFREAREELLRCRQWGGDVPAAAIEALDEQLLRAAAAKD